MMTQTFKSFIATAAIGITAAASLNGCVVSDNPAVNTVATVATAGAIATLFYNLSDGYYYDHDYNRMPRGYRPDRNARIERVNNIEEHRRQFGGRPGDNRPNGQERMREGGFNGQRPQMQQQAPQRMQPQRNERRPGSRDDDFRENRY